MIRCKKVSIRKSELHTTVCTVAAWEAPVLEAVWGSSFKDMGETLREGSAPDAEHEYQRLQTVYKESEDESGAKSGVTFVAAVYGQFGVGVKALARAIAEATVETESERLGEVADLLAVG